MPRRPPSSFNPPTTHAARVSALLAIAVFPLGAFVTGCGNVESPPAPHLVPGGGIGDGAISGLLNVYVTDEDTRAPIPSASVRVGAASAATPCTLSTDTTGLAVFDGKSCPSLTRGKQDLTASATGYVPSTWIGVNGTNLTITVRATTRTPVPTAVVTGTIAGWDSLPAPATGHQTLGIVGFSQTRHLGDRANDIAQGTRMVTVPVVGAINFPANVCLRNALANDCNWSMTTRTGAQAHYALVLDQDTNGTPNDDTDDTLTTIGWAVKTGLNLAAGQNVSAESLTLLTDAQMQSLTVAMSSPPSGLDAVTAFPILDLGANGRVPITSPVLNLKTSTTRVPALAGDLAGGHYDLLAQAQDAKNKDVPSTLAWMHGVDAAATITVGGWLAPPTAISAANGVYVFTPVAGATLHTAELQTATGTTLWSTSIFDGSASFALPALTPDPVPAGIVRISVSAIQAPHVNLQSVAFDEVLDTITGLSSDRITFTR